MKPTDEQTWRETNTALTWHDVDSVFDLVSLGRLPVRRVDLDSSVITRFPGKIPRLLDLGRETMLKSLASGFSTTSARVNRLMIKMGRDTSTEIH